MTDGQVLEFTGVTKRFNEVTAVSDFSARIEPGAVTAFLGPNGAGKTTTLRMLLGQVRPTSGTATIGGQSYAELRQPLRVIGSVLEETVYRPRRTANRQLTIAAKANDIPLGRVAEVLSLVGLENEGDARIGGFSLGMRQRLSVAHALLGDPGALVFDEPANGLDPEGIRWMRLLMRRLADEGRTVLVSSHVLSEVEQVADNVLVLSKGRLVLASGIEELADPSAGAVIVDAADRAALTAALAAAGFDIEVLRSGLTVRGTDARRVGAVAADAGIALTTLVQRGPTLEDVFIQLTRGGRLEPHAGLLATQLVAPAAAPAAPVEEPAHATAPADAEDQVTTDDTAAMTASAIAADAAAAVPGGPVAAAVVASGAGAAIVNDGDVVADEADAEGAVEVSVDGASASDDAGSDDAASDDETPADETPADETPADGPATDADAAQVAPGPVSAAGLPSFDDILFGNGDAAEEEATSFPGAEAPAHAVDGEAAGVPIGEEAGVEVFDDLGPTDGASDASSDSDEAAADEDADPRSAAVSSMLADAARAYFEDEPKDYPLGETPSESDGSETDDAAPSEQEAGTQAEADTATDETPNDEASDREASDDAPADGAPRTTVIEIIPEMPLTATDDELANADHYDQSGDGDQHHEHGEYRPRD
ncbi:ATP-binding cassette domain-containing protein [Microbacterium galbinum]|uniref:ATP-binding cassette domain-containing protein n=1 Tax=Microbacterium galbinum TaxID=2851646 RepID=A0ABY4IP25_9MICO|nr:ATP-binding cassette domain-containing protein [Microbacterium galbinum]UPL13797.1 ATP-binding cassette domain-containing protein [Microbacterium galbinum]